MTAQSAQLLSSETTVKPRQLRKVLVVDDDPGVLDFMREILSPDFQVLTADCADSGLKMALASENQPDLVILDLGLKNQNGLKICDEMKRKTETKGIPVLIYTGSDDIENLTNAFDRGADDYILKGSKTRELIARINSKIRKLENSAEKNVDKITCGNLTLYPAKFEVQLNGQTVALSVLEFNLLRFFVDNADRVIGRDEILAKVWKGSVVSNRTIDTHMVYLRKKLDGFDHNLSTVYGAGYILRIVNSN